MDDTIKNKIYTYTDYMKYSENQRMEIIGGCIHNISIIPSRIHQKIIVELSTLINNYIKSSNVSCELYVSPFDVLLIDDKIIENCINIVQPDISIIYDKTKLNDKGCLGAPDMIIEIVSSYNPSNDYVRKLILYQCFNVREYWIINPVKETILVYTLDENNQYAAPDSYTFKDKIKVSIYDNLEIDFNTLEL